MEKTVLFGAYVTEKRLAKDVCFAMCQAPGCGKVAVTKAGIGWLVECDISSKVKDRVGHVGSFMKKGDVNKVSWIM